MWGHVSPYGAFDLGMDRRFDLELKDAASSAARAVSFVRMRSAAKRLAFATTRSTSIKHGCG